MQKDKMDDTTIYTLALQRLFTAILAIEGWYGYFGRLSRIPAVQELFDRPSPPLDNSGGGDSSSGSGSSSADVAGKDSTIRPTAAVSPASLYLRLVRLSEWSDQVIVAWVIRDVQVMLGKYIKRLRESMTE
ncbi:hypothetical protein EV182_004694 [Spiromyces aspiralis]|uniref:Uncharacterized protein n=1 Tax=Spiromyces aspiralis TaxID=68401 RepID=A0ACC1HUW4_9FUNG|nr:hypothetical protein EV182_004694 [Spiromyces aspiralis]